MSPSPRAPGKDMGTDYPSRTAPCAQATAVLSPAFCSPCLHMSCTVTYSPTWTYLYIHLVTVVKPDVLKVHSGRLAAKGLIAK